MEASGSGGGCWAIKSNAIEPSVDSRREYSIHCDLRSPTSLVPPDAVVAS